MLKSRFLVIYQVYQGLAMIFGLQMYQKHQRLVTQIINLSAIEQLFCFMLLPIFASVYKRIIHNTMKDLTF